MQEDLLWGHSTTTWSEFCTFLTSPHLLGQFLYSERGQKQTFFDPLPPSSCPRSYWMNPFSRGAMWVKHAHIGAKNFLKLHFKYLPNLSFHSQMLNLLLQVKSWVQVNLNSLELKKCYFLHNHKQFCPKVPIILYFVRPKRPSGNCLRKLFPYWENTFVLNSLEYDIQIFQYILNLILTYQSTNIQQNHQISTYYCKICLLCTVQCEVKIRITRWPFWYPARGRGVAATVDDREVDLKLLTAQ